MFVIFSEGTNHISQTREGLVDVLGLVQSLPRGAGFTHLNNTSLVESAAGKYL